MGFVESVDEGGIFRIGTAFLRASAHAEIPVAERQHRFQLGQEFGVEAFFDDAPLVGREIARRRPERYMMDHRADPPNEDYPRLGYLLRRQCGVLVSQP